jgi:hypothetical protein
VITAEQYDGILEAALKRKIDLYIFKEVNMRSILIIVSLACAILASCAPANITAVKWDYNENESNVETRCEHIDMRNKSSMNKIFTKYDGWQLIFISEYTTGNKFGTDAAVCFARTKSALNSDD